MPDIPAALGRRYGPLPGYGWVAVAGVGTFIIIRRRRAAAAAGASSAPASSTTTADLEQQAYGTGYGDGYGAGVGVSGYGSGAGSTVDSSAVPLAGSTFPANADTGTATPATPAGGGAATPAAAKATPVKSPAPARPATRKPPARKPPARTGTVTKKHAVYTVKRGDTLSRIAARYHVSLAKLEKANPSLKRGSHNFGLIRPGDKVTIP